MNVECFYQRGSKFENSYFADGKNSGKQKTFIADSASTSCGANFCCKCKGGNISNESNDESYSPPPGIGFTFAACHLPLSQQVDGFQFLVDSGSSKHFTDPELIRGVESRMLEYTRIEPTMEIKAAGVKVLRGIAQGTLLVIVHGTNNVL